MQDKLIADAQRVLDLSNLHPSLSLEPGIAHIINKVKKQGIDTLSINELVKLKTAETVSIRDFVNRNTYLIEKTYHSKLCEPVAGNDYENENKKSCQLL